jgi:hypothetical protein
MDAILGVFSSLSNSSVPPFEAEVTETIHKKAGRDTYHHTAE